ncbi:MAG: hypothetical protein ACI9SX_001002 [Pseudoalteromonas tetraodonis]|jgi:hypothetical protein
MTKNSNLDKYRPKVSLANVLKFTTSHPGLAVFMVYATIAIAGFIYLVTFYSYFDLEITVYLEIGDILVAGVKDPMVMLMVLGAFSVVLFSWGIAYIAAPISAWLDKKFDKGIFRFIPHLVGVQSVRSFWYSAVIILTVYFFLFISVHSEHKAQSIIEQKQSLILVDSAATSGTGDDYSLLGTSMNYVFLYNHQSESTLILPLESINSLEPNTSLKQASVPAPTI